MNPQQPGLTPTAKRALVLTLIAGVIGLAMILIAGYGFVSVEVTSTTGNSGDISYDLTNQGSGKATSTKSTGSVKKLVTRGHYEVMVRSGSNSYFTTVKSGGFFTTTKVSAKLEAEKGRRFIGDNPSPCMYMLGNVLTSYECANTPFTSLSRHVPATATQSTYVLKSSTSSEGTIEAILPTKQGNTVILKAPPANEDQGVPHTAYTVSDTLELANGKPLADLNASQTYTAYPYKDGFVMINDEFGQVTYFSDPGSKPQAIQIDPPKDTKQVAYAADARGSRVLIAYANKAQADKQDPDQAKTTRKVSGTVVVNDGSETRSYTVSAKFANIKLCGDKYLCAITDRQVEVFDISGKKLKLLYRIDGVNMMLTTADKLLVVRSNEVMAIDTPTGTGAVQYHVQDYTTCGIQPTGPSYTLCLINKKNRKVALYIDRQSTTDEIDKKVAQMLNTPEVRTLSIYGNFITVSPEVGSRSFQPASNAFGYDPRRVSSANAAITEAAAKAGIDRNKYQVRSTIQP